MNIFFSDLLKCVDKINKPPLHVSRLKTNLSVCLQAAPPEVRLVSLLSNVCPNLLSHLDLVLSLGRFPVSFENSLCVSAIVFIYNMPIPSPADVSQFIFKTRSLIPSLPFFSRHSSWKFRLRCRQCTFDRVHFTVTRLNMRKCHTLNRYNFLSQLFPTFIIYRWIVLSGGELNFHGIHTLKYQ